MPDLNEFWLTLHELAEAYDAQGLAAEERTAYIVEQFRNVAPAARQQLLADLFQLTSELPDIYARTAAVERAADAVNWRRRNGCA